MCDTRRCDTQEPTEQDRSEEVAKVSGMLVKTHLTQMSTKETDEQHMRELPHDAVDLVTEYGDDGGDKVAMMHWPKNEDRKGEMNVTSDTSKLPLVGGSGNRPTYVCYFRRRMQRNSSHQRLGQGRPALSQQGRVLAPGAR